MVSGHQSGDLDNFGPPSQTSGPIALATADGMWVGIPR
jgi:hypothetical protein